MCPGVHRRAARATEQGWPKRHSAGVDGASGSNRDLLFAIHGDWHCTSRCVSILPLMAHSFHSWTRKRTVSRECWRNCPYWRQEDMTGCNEGLWWC